LTIGPGITILGAKGQIGINGGSSPASLLNEGVIHSDRPGTIRIRGVGTVNYGAFRSSSSGGSILVLDPWTNSGTVHVDGGPIITNNAWTNTGIVCLDPGSLLDANADFSQTSTGTLISEIISTADEGHGLIVVDGTATLDGVMRVEFTPGFVPAAGQSFVVLTYDDHAGEFSSIEAPGLDSSLQVVPTYFDTFFQVSIQPK
jgi:hypothetical protein